MIIRRINGNLLETRQHDQQTLSRRISIAHDLMKPSPKRTTVGILDVHGPEEFGALDELLGAKVALKIENVQESQPILWRNFPFDVTIERHASKKRNAKKLVRQNGEVLVRDTLQCLPRGTATTVKEIGRHPHILTISNCAIRLRVTYVLCSVREVAKRRITSFHGAVIENGRRAVGRRKVLKKWWLLWWSLGVKEVLTVGMLLPYDYNKSASP